MGDPCAGHVNAIPLPSDFVGKASKTAGNLGFADPIGSRNIYMSYKILLT